MALVTRINKELYGCFSNCGIFFTSNNQKLKDVTKKLNQQLVPKLQTIDGVQNAQLNGQTNREVSLKFKQKFR